MAVVAEEPTETFETTSNPGGFENPPGGGERSSMYNNTSASSGYSYLLNGGYASRIGLGKSYHVYPGDVVKIQAFARYEEGSTTPPTTGFASALLSALRFRSTSAQ
jgi:hypothetical protein